MRQFNRVAVKKYQFINLLEMLNFSAADWNEIIRQLDALQNALSNKVALSLLGSDRDALLLPLKKIRDACEHLGLPFSKSYVDEIIQMIITKSTIKESMELFLDDVAKVLTANQPLSPPPVPKINRGDSVDPTEILQEMKILRKRIDDELKGREFFALESKWAYFFYDPQPFGEKVNEIFPQAIKDIEEAGKCLALERSTACVFHLMRVMELSLQKLGSKLGLGREFLEDAHWQKILNTLNKSIEALPRTTNQEKEIQRNYYEAVSHLFAVKNAWRNNVMHVRGTYGQEDAAEIFTHVKAFLGSLTSKIL